MKCPLLYLFTKVFNYKNLFSINKKTSSQVVLSQEPMIFNIQGQILTTSQRIYRNLDILRVVL